MKKFKTTEDAWFWFVRAALGKPQELTERPCKPNDIMQVLDTLHRGQVITMEHLLVLRHYGRRQKAPDNTYSQEMRAHKLWTEAIDALTVPLTAKEIIDPQPFNLAGLRIVK